MTGDRWLYTDSYTAEPLRYVGEGTQIHRSVGEVLTGGFALAAELGDRAWVALMRANGGPA